MERVLSLISSFIESNKLLNKQTPCTLDITRTFSLLEWTPDVLLNVVTRALFGDRLLGLEPRLLEIFCSIR